MNSDSEQIRIIYENAIKQNPSNIEAVQYLAVWHLERHSFQQARKYFGHLATLRAEEPDVWLCLSVCCAMAEEFVECAAALKAAEGLIINSEHDLRVKFCHALRSEKRKDYTTAMEGYVSLLNECATTNYSPSHSGSTIMFMKELRGEIMLRIAVLKKDMGAIDQAMQMCGTITSEQFSDSIRANALCLKGLLHEMRSEFPASEVVYRSVLQISSGHSIALERLGRVYLRYRETIPAAVQCFFKSVETNPSNHIAWYLLGRCYMATSQYSDACEAYNRAVNLNCNDPQVWCSLGVLYYAFGQYRESLGMLSRALKLDSTMADAWYNVGALYDMCDQTEDAQQAYHKAKENGLAERFARAGMGVNPVAMQSMQFMNNSLGASNSSTNDTTNVATAATTATASTSQDSTQNNKINSIGTGSSNTNSMNTSVAMNTSKNKKPNTELLRRQQQQAAAAAAALYQQQQAAIEKHRQAEIQKQLELQQQYQMQQQIFQHRQQLHQQQHLHQYNPDPSTAATILQQQIQLQQHQQQQLQYQQQHYQRIHHPQQEQQISNTTSVTALSDHHQRQQLMDLMQHNSSYMSNNTEEQDHSISDVMLGRRNPHY